MAELPRTMRSTANAQGWTLPYLDPYCSEFVELARSFTKPVADLGCGYGYTTLKLLEAGATVIANDLSESQLEELRASVPPHLAPKVTIRAGDVTKLFFESGSLSGILAARWIHFLTSEQDIRDMFSRFFDWLQSGGKLCVTCNTLTHIATPEAYEEYLKKKKRGDEWPGWMSHLTIREHIRSNVPDVFYGFDVESLTREVEKAGFQMEKCEMYGTSGVTKAWLDNNCVGIIATKL